MTRNYLLDPNTCRRIFPDLTVVEHQVSHVRAVLTGREKALVDRLDVYFPQAVDETDAAAAEKMRSLWFIRTADDPIHDFTYADKWETEAHFSHVEVDATTPPPRPWLTTLEIIVTSRCNERCLHCYIPNGEKDAAVVLDKETVKEALRQFRELNGMKVVFSGGEPLLHPDIWELMSYCRELDLMVLINSNLLTLTAAQARKLKELRVFNVQVSLYSTLPAVHDGITQRKGSHERTHRSIELLILENVPALISCPVMQQNHREVAALKRQADLWGLDCYFDYIMMARHDGNADNLATCLTPEETKAVVRCVVQGNPLFMEAIRSAATEEELLQKHFARRWHACQIMSNRLGLDADGTLYPCPGWNGLSLGNIRETSLREVWTTSSLTQELRATDPHRFERCQTCQLHNFCDMCPVYNFNENGAVDKVCTRFCTAARLLREVVLELWTEQQTADVSQG